MPSGLSDWAPISSTWRQALGGPRLHLILTVLWVLLIIPSLTLWKDALLWVIIMSVWANVAGHWGAYQAARTKGKASRFHKWLTILWVVLTIPSVLFWSESLLWVIVMSVWANVAGHWGAYEAARNNGEG